MSPWWGRLALGLVVAAGLLLGVGRRLLVIVTVRGDSMRPWLADGERVVALSRPGRLPLRRGWVVCGPLADALARTAFGDQAGTAEGLYVKRVVAGPGDRWPGEGGRPVERIPAGEWFLQGDNPTSADSRHWGTVPDGAITAVVVARLGAARDAAGR